MVKENNNRQPASQLDTGPPAPADGPPLLWRATESQSQKTQQQARRAYAKALVNATERLWREDGAVADLRWKQLLEISNDGSCSTDARECAFHDLALEFPSE